MTFARQAVPVRASARGHDTMRDGHLRLLSGVGPCAPRPVRRNRRPQPRPTVRTGPEQSHGTNQAHAGTCGKLNTAIVKSFLHINFKAFDKNFKRDQQGNYSKLDFAYLKDISTIDFKLRMLILRMTGDIEHALRIRFNNLISRVQEDGYQVIADYEKDQSLCYAKQDKPFVPENDYKKSVYTEGMIDKYLDQKPVWLFWETCTLNSLIRCYSSFLEHRKFCDMTYSLLYGVRLLRNSASHHNCLLIPPAATIKKTIVLDSLMPIFLATDDPARGKTLDLAQSDPLIHDLSCILLSHINLVKSAGMRRYTEDQAASVLRRIDEHAAWYKDPQAAAATSWTNLPPSNCCYRNI